MMTQDDRLDAQDLPPYLHAPEAATEETAGALPASQTLVEAERAHIVHVLRETGGVISAAAIRLDVPRTTLNALMRRLGITRDSL
jgi:transcriptional regulator with GAF, ATPase, and Fis domain